MLLSRYLIFLVVFASSAASARRHRTTSSTSTSSIHAALKTSTTTSAKSTSSTHSTPKTTSTTSSKSTSSTHTTVKTTTSTTSAKKSTTSTTSVKSTSSTHSTPKTTSTTSSKSTSSAHTTLKTTTSTTSAKKTTTSTTSTTDPPSSTSTSTSSSTKSTSSPIPTTTTTATTTTPLTPHGTVILPLYISPIPSAWDPLYTTLAANPELKFQLVVNPANGPGAAGTYPDSDYLANIPLLRTYPNTIPLCYVATGYTTRAITDVLTDIATCQSWTTYTEADIHMSGIFFDEVEPTYSDAAFAYMSNITTYARTILGPGNDTIVFNPGTVVSAQWYTLPDYIVAFEAPFADYAPNVITNIAPAQIPQSLFILYSYTGTAAEQQTLVETIIAAGINSLFITTVAGYTDWSSLMAQFCSAMDLT